MMVENQTKPNHAQLPTTAPEEKKKKNQDNKSQMCKRAKKIV